MRAVAGAVMVLVGTLLGANGILFLTVTPMASGPWAYGIYSAWAGVALMLLGSTVVVVALWPDGRGTPDQQ